MISLLFFSHDGNDIVIVSDGGLNDPQIIFFLWSFSQNLTSSLFYEWTNSPGFSNKPKSNPKIRPAPSYYLSPFSYDRLSFFPKLVYYREMIFHSRELIWDPRDALLK